ncbi:MAG: DUF4230 domain-containing protein [Treponema sp.]|nr:DUF4230 domain-containing protein [Treponema sp.]
MKEVTKEKINKKENKKPAPKENFLLKSFNRSLSKILIKIFLIALIISGLFLGGKFGWKKLGEIQTEKKSAIVFRELERCAELVTIKNTYSDIISIKKTRIAGLAKSISIIKYTGIIRAGIMDLSSAQIKISNRGKDVEVKLPPVEVLSNDVSNIEVFDENKSIFVSVTVKDIMDEIRINRESASAQILESGFLEEGKEQAKKIIESLLYASGFENVKVK